MTEPIRCPECDSKDISIIPVPGLWIQYSCDSCDYYWWVKSDLMGRTEVSQKPPDKAVS